VAEKQQNSITVFVISSNAVRVASEEAMLFLRGLQLILLLQILTYESQRSTKEVC